MAMSTSSAISLTDAWEGMPETDRARSLTTYTRPV